MITKQRCLFFQVGDQFFKTLEEAQIHDLKNVIEKCDDDRIRGVPENAFAEFMVKNAVAITDILTTTPTSRAKARKTNGGAKKSQKRPKLQPAPVSDV